jgi:hypothetical protein
MRSLLFFVAIFLLSSTLVRAGTVSGFVHDASNGEGLIGANVYLEGTTIGSSTNRSGYYVIPKAPPGTFNLIVHFIGYKKFSKEINVSVDENVEVNAHLEVESIEMQKVVVTDEAIPPAERMFEKPISKIDLSARQINRVPQVAEADLLRALQTLPGILPISDFSTALYVRGGTPDQNLNLIDGTDVYNPEHAFGLFSTFNTDAIKKVELSKGGFGAQYGGRLSSILDVTNLDGNREEFEGKSSVSLLSAKTTVQMPIGSFGSFSGSFRRTYFDKTIAKAIDDVPDYYFYDGHAKAFFDINPKNKLTLSFYGGEDVLDLIFREGSENEAGFNYDWGNTTGSMRWTHIFSPQLFANFWITGSRFESSFRFNETFDFTEDNLISDITFKGNFDYHYSEHLTTTFGFEEKNLHNIFDSKFPGGHIKVDARPEHWAAFVQNSWKPTVRWDIEGGLRYNFFNAQEDFHRLAPRFSAKYRLTDSANLKLAGGQYYQFLHRIPRAFIAAIWSSSNQWQKASSATHIIAGIQKDLGWAQFEIEGFRKQYDNVYSFNQTLGTEVRADDFDENDEPIYTETRGIFDQGDGHSTGLDMLLRKDTGAMTGWLGYSLAITKYGVNGINQNREFAPRHDRTHTINLVGNLDWKNFRRALRGEGAVEHKSNWRLGFTLIYTSGQPLTTPGSGYFFNSMPDQDGDLLFYNDYGYYPADINNYRLPYYARLDLSITYERHFKSWSIFPYLQLFNIGNRKNVWFVDYDLDDGVQDVDPVHMFPVIPTIGINITY